MTRLPITGGSGYLGTHLMQAAAALDWDVCGPYFSRPFAASDGQPVPLDLGQPEAVATLVADLRPDASVHTACSNRNAATLAAIEPAARHLACAAHAPGARLVHVSTDMVFDGEHAPYDDEAPVAPLGAYGRAKAAAEAIVAAHCPSAAIVRPSLIWSLEPVDRQTTWLVDGVRRGEWVTLFTDEVRCPVHLHDLADALLEVSAGPELAGTFNLGGPQALNRWDFGLKLLEELGQPRGSTVLPGSVACSGLVRARDRSLRCNRAQRLLSTHVLSMDEIVARPRLRHPRFCEG